jgi:putative membrane protein
MVINFFSVLVSFTVLPIQVSMRLLTTGNATSYPNNTWITATGTISLEYDKTLNDFIEQNLPVLHISKIKETDAPDNPYVYRVF